MEPSSDLNGTILTFYSFKGGVGRTMALSNVAALLADRGHRVLMVDFDLEAPGLEPYFATSIRKRSKSGGVLDLLTKATEDGSADWQNYLTTVRLNELNDADLELMHAGNGEGYFGRLDEFDWDHFFSECNGGDFIEHLRDEWKKHYHFTLIDSRTGYTDTGGVCTIQFPDVLVPVFTANSQSLQGVREVVDRANRARQELAYDRMSLVILPVLSRYDGQAEHERSKIWLDRASETIRDWYGDWLSKESSPKSVLERTKVPHIPFFSFGEELAVTDGTGDPQSMGYIYDILARLTASDFRDAEKILGNVKETEERSGQLPTWLKPTWKWVRRRRNELVVAGLATLIFSLIALTWRAAINEEMWTQEGRLRTLSNEKVKLETENMELEAAARELANELADQGDKLRRLELQVKLARLGVAIEPLEVGGTFRASVTEEEIDRLGERAQLLTEHGGVTELDLNGCNVSSLNLSGLVELEELNFSNCKLLQSVVLPQGSALRKVDASFCILLERIDGLSGLAELEELDLVGNNKLGGLEDALSGLNKLKVLNLSSIDSLIDLKVVGGLPAVESLLCIGCSSLERLDGVQGLPSLRALVLERCGALQSIEQLRGATSLEFLNLADCISLENLNGIEGLTRLSALQLSRCEKLESIGPLRGAISLEGLYLDDCINLASLSGLEELARLRTLQLSRCAKLESVEPLRDVTHLKTLELGRCNGLKSLDGIGGLTNLETLGLAGTSLLTDTTELSRLVALKTLDLRENSSLKKLGGLGDLQNLESLSLFDSDAITNVNGLEGLKSLVTLDLSRCDSLKDVSGLKNLPALKVLDFTYCDRLENLDGLEGLDSLQTVELRGCKMLNSIAGLAAQRSIEALDLTGISRPTVAGLENLQQLKSLRWRSIITLDELPTLKGIREFDPAVATMETAGGKSPVKNFEPLTRFPNLEFLYTYGFDDQQVAKIKRVLPGSVNLVDDERRKYEWPKDAEAAAE